MWTAKQKQITLRDTENPEITFEGAVMVVRAKDVRVIGSITCTPILRPCSLYVTPGALGYLGDEGVIGMFNNHFSGAWLTANVLERRENDAHAKANAVGDAIYDMGSTVMIVTYIGGESTLLLREEY